MPGGLALPRDDAPHFSEPVEWWYWSGQVRSSEGRAFGFHLAFFRTFELGRPLCFAHHMLLDVETGRVHQSFSTARKGAAFTVDRFILRVPPNDAEGGGGSDRLHAATPETALELSLESLRPPVLHHGAGYKNYEVGGFTWYYSRTRMKAQGALVLGGAHLVVEGTVWFDHQWGRLSAQMNAGWDWFGIQLDDGRDVMLFFRRLLDGRTAVGATVVAADGAVRCLDEGKVAYEALGTWMSPRSGRRYGSGWRIDLEGETLVVEPVVRHQEIQMGPTQYWEGAATVSGDAEGRAFVELVGASAGVP